MFAVIAPLYTRFVKPLEALSNARRRAIYDYIRERGYSWPRELERVFNMAYGEVCWHLTVLERVDLIYNFYALKRRFYVNKGLPLDEAIIKIFREQAGREPSEEEVLKARRSCSQLL
ncbi:winged helix-turn-helix domain-containing protein [Pyrobaculum aerophilum]|uniref:winged helix-turn-helix domain-containing protein n=1 Tax=Pyrobaculum aerophilum TaxID=13773 RepID=UPI00257A1B36|nr:winged helix-turn-helix domain-containing protein [Pyrobaculum sp.]